MIKFRKIVLISLFFIFSLFIGNNYCNASSSGFDAFNNAPRVRVDTTSSKDSNVKVIFTDYNGIDSSNIKFYSVNDKNEKREITDKNVIVSQEVSQVSKNKNIQYTYTISKDYLNKTTKRFYVTVADRTGKTLKTYFKIESKEDQYEVNYAIRTSKWKYNDKKISFMLNDADGISKIALYDMNDGEKQVKNEENLTNKSLNVSLGITKLKADNKGTYQIKIVTEDGSSEKQENIAEVSFRIPNHDDTVRKDKKIKILFVGNSKTYINNIPKKVQELAKSGGYTKVSVKKVTQGGKTLSYLANKYKGKIEKEAYDYVILQEQSDNYTNYNDFLGGAKQVSKLVRGKNEEVNIYVRQVWLYKNSGVQARTKVYQNAEKVAENINANLIYDGKAFDECRSKYESINLFKDDKHQSEAGAYLSACSIYEAVFKESSVGLKYKSKLNADQAKKLQEIAHNIYKVESRQY